MASQILGVNYKGKKTKLASSGGAEDDITVKTRLDEPSNALPANPTNTQLANGGSLPGGRAVVQFVSSAAWLYHSVAGQVVADGFPVAAGQLITLTLRELDKFYISSTAVIHAIVVDT